VSSHWRAAYQQSVWRRGAAICIPRGTFRAISHSRRYHWPNDRIGDGLSYALGEQVDDLARLGGAKSPRVFARFHDHLESILSNVEGVVIPDASHMMHEDNTPAFNRVVLRVLPSP
jgi:pimeloyl-ACP methyl ester carboxylesterase